MLILRNGIEIAARAATFDEAQARLRQLGDTAESRLRQHYQGQTGLRVETATNADSFYVTVYRGSFNGIVAREWFEIIEED
jgi:hypothetical protein